MMQQHANQKEYDEETLKIYKEINLGFVENIIPILEVDEPIIRLHNYHDSQLGVCTQNKVFIVNNSGRSSVINLEKYPQFRCDHFYQIDSEEEEEDKDECSDPPAQYDNYAFCFNDENSAWLSCLTKTHSLSLIDFRAPPNEKNGVTYTEITSEPIYSIWKLGQNHILVASSFQENILSLFDARNVSVPVQIYSFHNSYIKKIFTFRDFFYSIDEDGHVYKQSYDTQNLLGHFKFSQDQSVEDVAYNYKHNHFLTVIDQNILYHTEDKLFDIVQDESTYQCVCYNKLFNRIAFGQDDIVVFCDDKSHEQYFYDKQFDGCAQITPFKSSFVFSDGQTLFYDNNMVMQ